MGKWESVKTDKDRWEVRAKRKKGKPDVLAVCAGEKAKERAAYLTEAANNYRANWKYKHTADINTMDPPIEWVKARKATGRVHIMSSQATDDLCYIPNCEEALKWKADLVVKFCNQFELRRHSKNEKQTLVKSKATGEGILKALDNGCKIHAFRSGGGLRVVRIEKSDKLVGYGEHPDVLEALKHAEEDYLYFLRKRKTRDYHTVYGKLYPHYMTGSSEASCDLDRILLKGSSFDCYKGEKEIVFVINGWVNIGFPKDAMDLTKKTGFPVYWKTDRGYYYKMTYSAGMTPSGSEGWSSRCVKEPKGKGGHDGTMYEEKFTGNGVDFWKAFDDANKRYKVQPKTEIVSDKEVEELKLHQVKNDN